MKARVARGEIAAAAVPEPAPGFIDVRELIEKSSVGALCASAESYFSRLDSWEFHLIKPFNSAKDAANILGNFAVVIDGLDLVAGQTVLDFGAGSCWASRFLTQMGCRVIALDASPTALEIGRELYRRLPVIGDQPPPEFLTFDGVRLPLAEESVDRIFCFDAFHHAPNPDVVIREMARVLRPGGIAGFCEPGPEHSKTPQSQYEMRMFGVVENDVDLRGIWAAASAAGFDDLKLAVFSLPRFSVSVDEYDDLLEDGLTAERYSRHVRGFLRDVRTFFLYKGGTEAPDSRRAVDLRAEIEVVIERTPIHPGEQLRGKLRVRNSGAARWLPSRESPGGVSAGCHLYRGDGTLVNLDFHWIALPSRDGVEPGEEVEVSFDLPPLESGTWELEFDAVADRVCWFAQVGSSPVRVRVVVEAKR